MNRVAIHNAIRARFGTEVEDQREDLSLVLYDNKVLKDNEMPGADKTWARVSVKGAESKRASTGGTVSRHDRPGVLMIQLFGPIGVGNGSLLELADVIEAAFMPAGGAAGGIRYRSPTTEDIGENNGWYQINVSVPFLAEHLA